tara:strand:+ start:12181 stop:12336 length:156 start_codon:yes stop_codon:yes gene_type:complete
MLSSERTKWLLLIGLVAITGGFSVKVLSHSFGHPCNAPVTSSSISSLAYQT